MKNYSALVDISWLSPTFAPHSVNQLRSLRITGDGSESTKFPAPDFKGLRGVHFNGSTVLRFYSVDGGSASKTI